MNHNECIIIPVMDVRPRFGILWCEYDDRTSIIVVDMNGNAIGFFIDSVSEVRPINDEEIIKKPKISCRNGSDNITKQLLSEI